MSARHVPLTQRSGYWQQSTVTFSHTSGRVLTSEWHSEPSATHAALWSAHFSSTDDNEDRSNEDVRL